jgi:hypothetical protein
MDRTFALRTGSLLLSLALLGGMLTGCSDDGSSDTDFALDSNGGEESDQRTDASEGVTEATTRQSSTREEHDMMAQGASQPATRPGEEEGIPLDLLTGRWRAEGVDAPMGDVAIELGFAENGKVSIEAWSDLPLVGQVRDKVRSYELRDGKVVSRDLRGGVKMPVEFEGQDVMILEYTEGESVRFRRIYEEDDTGVVGKD